MNPELLEDVATLFKNFDKIPSPQFYQLLIGLIPQDKRYYPWVKSSKKPFSKKLLELISTYYEISQKEAEEYVILLSSTEKGNKELEDLCRAFGLNDKEVESVMKGNDNDE